MKLIHRIVLLLAGLSAGLLFAAGDQPAKPSKTPAPRAPFKHFENKVPGFAIAEFTVASAGAVKDLRMIEGTDREFEMAVMAVVQRWKFKAASKGGKPAEDRKRYRFTFRAGEEEALVQEEALPGGAAGK